MLMMAVLLSTTVAMAKDIKTMVVTTTPVMHCENCENKIKGNLRFEKGVKEITTDIPTQTVTITYDADKTSESKLTAAFEKIGYTVAQKDNNKKQGCGGCKAKAGNGEQKQGCCKDKAAAQPKQGCCGACKDKAAAAEKPQAGCCKEKAAAAEATKGCCKEKAAAAEAKQGCGGCKAKTANAEQKKGGCCKDKANK